MVDFPGLNRLDNQTITFTAPFPKIGAGKRKNHLALTNNISYWYRFRKTIIKNDYKSLLSSWFIQEPGEEYEKPDKVLIVFQPLRPDNRSIDFDAGCVSAYKWIIDLMVDLGYADDDNIFASLNLPSKKGVDYVSEPSIHVSCFFYRKQEDG